MKELQNKEAVKTPPLTNTPQTETPIMVSFFNGGITQTVPTKQTDIKNILDCIKNGYWKKKIENLRGQDDHIAFKRDKEALPYFTASGTFKKRGELEIIDHSGLICLDFDNVCYVEDCIYLINESPYTFASFISPSGEGIKVICKMAANVALQQITTYYSLYGYYFALCGIRADTKARDLSRACFVSSDANLYHNPTSEIWTT